MSFTPEQVNLIREEVGKLRFFYRHSVFEASPEFEGWRDEYIELSPKVTLYPKAVYNAFDFDPSKGHRIIEQIGSAVDRDFLPVFLRLDDLDLDVSTED